MITLNCPDCGQNYELEDSMAGKKASCACGAMLFVPDTPDIPEGFKACPACKSTTSEDSVICVSCGYNYQTGGRMRSAETRVLAEDPPSIILIRRLWKPALLLLLMTIAGIITYISLFVKPYGISSKNPLGKLAAIEKHLARYGYVKQGDSGSPPKSFGADAKKIEWLDAKLENSSKGMWSEKVFIITDASGEILAIGANFKGGMKTVPGDTGSATGRFMSSLWKAAGLQFPPEYETIKVGEGRWASSYMKAKTSSPALKAEWTEYPSEVLIIPSAHTMVISLAKTPEVSYGDIQEDRFSFSFPSGDNNADEEDTDEPE